jgi:hypothetical protein
MKFYRIAVLLVALCATISLSAQEKPDLTGRVVDEGGAPIADASVFIYTAGPRVGPGYI